MRNKSKMIDELQKKCENLNDIIEGNESKIIETNKLINHLKHELKYYTRLASDIQSQLDFQIFKNEDDNRIKKKLEK